MARGRKPTSAELADPELRSLARRFYANDGEPHPARPIKEVLTRLFTQASYSQNAVRYELERVWREVADPAVSKQTKVGAIRRGELEILVDNPMVLAELEGFAKRRLLKDMNTKLQYTKLKSLRFRRG